MQVSWIRHRDIHILTVGTYTYTTDQRFQTAYHREINEWTMQIKWAQKRDAGMYECQLSTIPIKSYSVWLNVVGTCFTLSFSLSFFRCSSKNKFHFVLFYFVLMLMVLLVLLLLLEIPIKWICPCWCWMVLKKGVNIKRKNVHNLINLS